VKPRWGWWPVKMRPRTLGAALTLLDVAL
jgi:hypothetical protein